MRHKLVAAVAEKLGVEAREVLVTRGALCVASDPGRAVPVTEAIVRAESKFGTLGATGFYNTPPRGGVQRGAAADCRPRWSDVCPQHFRHEAP